MECRCNAATGETNGGILSVLRAERFVYCFAGVEKRFERCAFERIKDCRSSGGDGVPLRHFARCSAGTKKHTHSQAGNKIEPGEIEHNHFRRSGRDVGEFCFQIDHMINAPRRR